MQVIARRATSADAIGLRRWAGFEKKGQVQIRADDPLLLLLSARMTRACPQRRHRSPAKAAGRTRASGRTDVRKAPGALRLTSLAVESPGYAGEVTDAPCFRRLEETKRSANSRASSP